MSSHLPRVPLRFQYPDFYKSETTNYSSPESVPSVELRPEARSPLQDGYRDQLFRRYPDGYLDLGAAVSLVLDVLYKLKGGSPLNDQECLIVSSCFPHAAEGRVPQFSGGAAKSEARSRFRLSDAEVASISAGVAQQLVAAHEYLLFGIK